MLADQAGYGNRGHRYGGYSGSSSYSGGRSYSGRRTGGYSPGSYSSHSGGSSSHSSYSGSYRSPGYNRNSFAGGCSSRLMAPMNSILECSIDQGGCTATCISNYQFPSGVSQISIICHESIWKMKGAEDNVIPACSPTCLPACQNGGTCASPNVCRCPDDFFGIYCQYESKKCVDYPPTPMNSKKMCTEQVCSITCANNHQFPDGSTTVELYCKEGEWVPYRNDWTSVPDCQASCDPPCQNGGKCLSFNTCQCPQEFRGPQCQYSKESCDIRRLVFNGNYNCSGDSQALTCTLKCPSGMNFQTEPAAHYVCLYETGVFQPSDVPKCIFSEYVDQGNELLDFVFNERNTHKSEVVVHHTSKTAEGQIFRDKQPTCLSWQGVHYKTFDNKVLNFKSDCVYTLLSDSESSLQIQTPSLKKSCDPNNSACKLVNIYLNGKNYQLATDATKHPVIMEGDSVLKVPSQLPGLLVEFGGPHSLVAHLAGEITIIWNFEDVVEIKLSTPLRNKTRGLCGPINGNGNAIYEAGASLQAFADLARIDIIGETCEEKIEENQACVDISTETNAHNFCNKMLEEIRFGACLKVVNAKEFYDACKWDYCACELVGQKNHTCGCQSIEMFVKECSNKGVQLKWWRDSSLCPMQCTGGRVYNKCGSELSCSAPAEEVTCEEGCFCPPGTYAHNNTCIPAAQCPCVLRQKYFLPGETVPNECNTCTCVAGTWSCTELQCTARCEALGDPHYITFDRKYYDFMGKCSYYLLQHSNYSVAAENVPCDGSISENMGFSVFALSTTPSCTKSVTVTIGDVVIKLKQGREVTVNNKDEPLPILLKQAYIREASSIFVQVELFDGVEIWWDGITRVYIDVPPELKGKTKGLCGTFNGNQKDDFLTPEGDVEQDAVAFANKWKTNENCESVSEEQIDPCQKNHQKRDSAKRLCSWLHSSLFLDCHFYVDPSVYYKNCLYDMCSCNKKTSDCLCPLIAAYAKECSRQGVPINWRTSVRECGVQCPRGQQFHTCVDSCARSCQDLSREKKCSSHCVESCTCPAGLIFDHKGHCVPISSCPCVWNGLQYPAGHKEVRRSSKGTQFCTCENARWKCNQASADDMKKYPNNTAEELACSASKHQVYTHCEPSQPVTCRNMHKSHSSREQSEAICYGGCVCKKGYVLDSISGACVRPDECPCHHGGKSYNDGDTIQDDCNTCTCTSGKWSCSEHICPSVCSTWGDSHFITFDNHIYDFQGTCEFVMAKGSLSSAEEDCFSVVLEMVSCGSSGISCPKSLTFTVGSGDKKEHVVFSDGEATSSKARLERITQRTSGLFMFAEVADLGLVLQWDRGTRVSLRADPKWKNKLRGLCGNYNDNSNDDFQTPSGGISEVSSQVFADSWKIFDYCPESQPITDTCKLYPNRKPWAVEKCSILKSHLFKPCHAEVSVDPFMARCIFDSCGCDQGGDCECLCSAIAAYVQQCNAHGVFIKWRSQQLCPMQCEESCSEYQACVPTCPPETCDNLLDHSRISELCKQDVCVEGCKYKNCAEGEVYLNSSLKQCVPKSECKPECLKIGNQTYYEGDFIEGDACHSCYCSRHQKTCTGQPCASTTLLPETTFTTMATTTTTTEKPTTIATKPWRDMEETCVPGWSDWLNKHHPVPGKVDSDIEPLPLINEYPVNKELQMQTVRCPIDMIKDIKCRTVDTLQSAKETGEQAECSLERGLYCEGGCHDYEISVYCQCGELTTVATTETSTVQQTLSEAPTTLPTTTTVSEKEQTVKPNKSEKIEGCLDGEEWDDCAINCDQLCSYYEHIAYKNGICLFGQKCTPGCRREDRPHCPPGHRWRDLNTCVKQEDCTCRSLTGLMIKPGTVVNESECESCQCLNNHYTCDSSLCVTTLPSVENITKIQQVHTDIAIMPTEVTTPPQKCPDSKFIPLLKNVPDDSFTASSTGTNSAPEKARLTSTGAWRPHVDDKEPFLQIDLGTVDIVYGITISGSPEDNEFVKSFYILYSVNNATYNYVAFMGMPELFKGPLTNTDRETITFQTPVEARYIRINPTSWTGAPAVRIEILGCDLTLIETTTLAPTMSTLPVCLDDMSVSMRDSQISVSSISQGTITAAKISLSGDSGWTPILSDKNQWLQFDFLGERLLTGIITSGGGPASVSSANESPAWVISYTIKYSADHKEWNPLTDDNGGLHKFPGNVNNFDKVTHYFKHPIKARFLRILPADWHNKILMRIQILGCYENYPELTTEIPEVETLLPTDCNVCPGVAVTSDICHCPPTEWWDGEICTQRTQCSCFVGFIRYPVGTVYDNEFCERCTCGLNGLAQCAIKECPPCSEGQRGELTPNCNCICKPCPTDTRLCPTSQVCIPLSSWCDGIYDCPDDEVNCPTTPITTLAPLTTLTPLTTLAPPTTTELQTTECPEIECPEGFILNMTAVEIPEKPKFGDTTWSPFGKKSKWNSYFKGVNRGSHSGRYKGGYHKTANSKTSFSKYPGHGTKTYSKTLPEKLVNEKSKCPEYRCVPIEKETIKNCTKPKCLPGYDLVTKASESPDECPRYTCSLKEIPLPDGRCNVTGRTFTTFDGTEYKYDICDHILARDRIHKTWSVRQAKKCPYIGPCKRFLLINFGNHSLQFNTDLTVMYNGYTYTIPQVQKIGALNFDFALKQISNKFIIFTSVYDFSVIWDSQGNTKIIVPGKSQGKVDGLCGFFDNNMANDKTKENGQLAKTTVEFGDSWMQPGAFCETVVCPTNVQKEAWKMCKAAIMEEPLSKCGLEVNLDKLLSQCVESICLCMQSSNSSEDCRCQALLEIVTECQVKMPRLDLSIWRVEHDCPVQCPPNLVYKECFKRICEPCCAELMVSDACPETEECFPGCYCPDGYIRSGEQCIKPTECRDCQCDGYGGSSRFVTFDRMDFTFKGNCTYTLAQTIEKTSGPKFSALITSTGCRDNKEEICLRMITLLYKEHSVQTINDNDNAVTVKIDGEIVTERPYSNKWMKVVEKHGKCVTVSLTKINVDLEFFNQGNGFNLRLPSHLYANRTEGICGKCNLNGTDDFKMKNGTITDDTKAFGESWLVNDMPEVIGKEESCHVEKEVECLPPPEHQDPCLKVLNEEVFGKCHPVVDPQHYVDNCHNALCNGASIGCRELEAYARDCQNEGICLDWRSTSLCPYKCPDGLEYKACGLGCTETCDNYEQFRTNPELCTSPRGDTCVCPEGKVLKNDTCVLETRCVPCDTEGHYPGDKWNPDTCTECTCSKNNVNCHRLQCTKESGSICERGFKSVVMVGTEDQCCPQYICVPEPTAGPVCPELQQPECGYGQVMKLEKTASGCQEFICQCMPPSECPSVEEEMNKSRPAGMVASVDKSGCCPKVTVDCKPETCSEPLPCPPFHEHVKKETEHCCPEYKCAIPERKCLYGFEYIEDSEKGGERLRKPSERFTELKSVGDRWSDGPCRLCECKESSTSASCISKVCSTPPQSEDYVYVPEVVNGKCCPIYKRRACKQGQQEYEVGSIWPSSDGNPCINLTCTLGPNGEITKQESVETCKKNCKEGWKYVEPVEMSNVCCGECKPQGCLVDGIVHEKDSTWMSEDNCTTYNCFIDNDDGMQVVASTEKCPFINDCPAERIYQDKCCKKCNSTLIEDKKVCTIEAVPLNETVGIVKLYHEKHGGCINHGHILGFNECQGTCESYTQYDPTTGRHESKCLCCKVKEVDTVAVALTCDDGFLLEKEVPIPVTCICQACGSNKKLVGIKYPV
ncbi:hemolectin isoform X3 [Rhodnius prolixus]